jgi:hypothetical protein
MTINGCRQTTSELLEKLLDFWRYYSWTSPTLYEAKPQSVNAPSWGMRLLYLTTLTYLPQLSRLLDKLEDYIAYGDNE